MRPAGGNAGGKELSAVFVGHIPAAPGNPAPDSGMGLYVQDGGLCLVEAQQEKPHMVLWAGLLDERQCGNLPACQMRQTQAPQRRCPSVYYFPRGGTQQKAGRDP